LKLFQEGYLSLFGEALLNEVLLKQQLQTEEGNED
jgi:hypothetical protein